MDGMIKLIKNIVKLGFSLVLLVIVIIVIANLWVFTSSWCYTKSTETIAKTPHFDEEVPALILGAGVIDNQYPSKVLQARLDAAVDLYALDPARQFIVSGDHAEDNYNEVQVMKNYLIDAGIPAEQIYQDHEGFSTGMSLTRFKAFYPEKKLIVITQPYHLSRAVFLARHIGIDAVGLKASEVKSTRLERETREVFARLKDVSVILNLYQDNPTSYDAFYNLNQSGNLSDQKADLERFNPED